MRMKIVSGMMLSAIMIVPLASPVFPEEAADVAGTTVAMISRVSSGTADAYDYYGAREFASAWNVEISYNKPTMTGQTKSEKQSEEAETEASSEDLHTDAAIQRDEISEQLKDASVDALCISAEQSDHINNKLKQAVDMGIPVITWGSDVDPASRNIMVAPDSSENMGKMLVQLGVDCLNQRDVKAESDLVQYCWLSSGQETAEETEWKKAGDEYISENYENWEKAADDGEKAIRDLKNIDVILCTDQEILMDQLEVLDSKNLTQDDITVTGFGSPSKIKKYGSDELIYEWGYWDRQLEGAVACYVAAYLGAGNHVHVGDVISVPYMGDYKIYENSVISRSAGTGEINSGVILLNEPLILKEENAEKYCF